MFGLADVGGAKHGKEGAEIRLDAMCKFKWCCQVVVVEEGEVV